MQTASACWGAATNSINPQLQCVCLPRSTAPSLIPSYVFVVFSCLMLFFVTGDRINAVGICTSLMAKDSDHFYICMSVGHFLFSFWELYAQFICLFIIYLTFSVSNFWSSSWLLDQSPVRHTFHRLSPTPCLSPVRCSLPLLCRSSLVSCNTICQFLSLFPEFVGSFWERTCMPESWHTLPNSFRVLGTTLRSLISLVLVLCSLRDQSSFTHLHVGIHFF